MWDENKRCDTEDCFPVFCFLFLISFFTLSHTQNHTDIPLLACGSSVCRSKLSHLSSQPSHSESNVRTSTRTLLAVSESFRKLYSNKYKEPSCHNRVIQKVMFEQVQEPFLRYPKVIFEQVQVTFLR